MRAGLLRRTNLHAPLATSNVVYKREQKFHLRQPSPLNENFNSNSSNPKMRKRDWKRTWRGGRQSSKIDDLCTLSFVLCSCALFSLKRKSQRPITKYKAPRTKHKCTNTS